MKINYNEFKKAKSIRKVSPNEMVKTLRELQEMSQNDLAELTGISQSNLSAIERGTKQIGRERAITLAKALKVHPSVILFSDFEMDEILAA